MVSQEAGQRSTAIPSPRRETIRLMQPQAPDAVSAMPSLMSSGHGIRSSSTTETQLAVHDRSLATAAVIFYGYLMNSAQITLSA
jgi:hypothetical protein